MGVLVGRCAMNSNKLAVRFLIVGAIALGLLVPLGLLMGLVSEREGHYHTARQAVTAGWGASQRVNGPLLVVPQRIPSGGWTVEGSPPEPYVLPAAVLDAQVTLRPQIRERGIFRIPVYVAELVLTGRFEPTELAAVEALDWSRARVLVGISDLHGIREAALRVGASNAALAALPTTQWLGTGLQADYVASSGDSSFSLTLSLRGSHTLAVTLPAARSALTMTSSWPHPGFRGRFLPESIDSTEQGFSARWASHELAQGLPKRWLAGATPEVLAHAVGAVELYEPVAVYRSVERAVKYGALFLAVTFLTLVCFELTTTARFHFVQYGATGMAMLVFFLVLLALAEHIDFAVAYAAATLVIIGLTGWYVGRITGSRRLVATFALALGCVYGVLYMLLRMEAYSLLAGTFVVIAGLAALMRVTGRLAPATSLGSEEKPQDHAQDG